VIFGVTLCLAYYLTSKLYDISPLKKSAVFCDMAPCGSRENRRFGGTLKMGQQINLKQLD
jgi:hypothetical protein